MTRTPDLDQITLAGGRVSASLADLIESIKVDYSTGMVSQLTVTALDGAAIATSALASAGTVLTYRGDPWQVGAYADKRGQDAVVRHEFTCRSAVARQLRRTYRASVETKVSPGEWIARRVTRAGGRVVCQPSAKRAVIAQTSGRDRQSELDVIASLASDLEWSWTEWGGRLYAGSRHWAWQTGPTGRLWAATWRADEATDVLSSDVTIDDDDTDSLISGTLTVPPATGTRIRPWDRIRLSGFGRAVNQTMLVEAVSFTADQSSAVELTVSVPHAPSRKSGSSS